MCTTSCSPSLVYHRSIHLPTPDINLNALIGDPALCPPAEVLPPLPLELPALVVVVLSPDDIETLVVKRDDERAVDEAPTAGVPSVQLARPSCRRWLPARRKPQSP